MTTLHKLLVWLGLRVPPPPAKRTLVFVTYPDADRLIRADPAWHIAPEEDNNRQIGWVWLQKELK